MHSSCLLFHDSFLGFFRKYLNLWNSEHLRVLVSCVRDVSVKWWREARLQWAEEQMKREELVGTEFRVWKEGKEEKMLSLSLGSKVLRTDSILDGEKKVKGYIFIEWACVSNIGPSASCEVSHLILLQTLVRHGLLLAFCRWGNWGERAGPWLHSLKLMTQICCLQVSHLRQNMV